MNILITGASGFIGKNLTEALRNIRDGKDKTRGQLIIDEIFEYDIDSPAASLDAFCARADFVFHLAGVNRPKNVDEFAAGNHRVASDLLTSLKRNRNRCPVMLSSSIQACLSGKYADSAYGKSKRDGEQLVFDYAQSTGATVYVYRFPNVFGKWCRPQYNSVVATFCFNIANDLPIRIDDRETQLELLYIDDLIDEMVGLLQGAAHRCTYEELRIRPTPEGAYCYVPTIYTATLGEIADLLHQISSPPETLLIPDLPAASLAKKLYSTYLSYLPKRKVAVPLKSNADSRGSFTELIKTNQCGQFSLNVIKPGFTKGEHWHHTKWEFFIVVSGHALIRERKIGTNEVWEFEVSGEKPEALHMLPGYTHNITNLSDTENLVTLMWANEIFDSNRPDTFLEKVVR